MFFKFEIFCNVVCISSVLNYKAKEKQNELACIKSQLDVKLQATVIKYVNTN